MCIGGFIKNSFIDYPGKISSVIFLNGCNYKCWYCHNKSLLNNNTNVISFEQIKSFLKTRIGQIDAVVFSGGEPTLQKDLYKMIKEVKELGFLIKLDTNGTNPTLLKKLIDDQLIDYCAMDIKNSLENYHIITKVECDVGLLLNSIEILKKSNINYEFRTTYSTDISFNDIEAIVKLISPCNNYFLQKFIPQENCDLPLHNLQDFEFCRKIGEKYNVLVSFRNL